MNYWGDVEKLEPSHIAGGKANCTLAHNTLYLELQIQFFIQFRYFFLFRSRLA